MPEKTARFLAERWKGQKMTEKEQRFQRDMDRVAEDPSIDWEKLRKNGADHRSYRADRKVSGLGACV